MYKIYVPVYNKRLSKKDQESLLLELKKCRIDFVLLTFGRILCCEEQLREELEIFNQNKRFLNENGINVGAWLAPTIGYGSSFFGDNDAETKFTHLHRLFSDTDVPGAYCPLDENFKYEFLKVIKKISETGVKLILLEDDFTLSGGKFSNDTACCCPKHLEWFGREYGKKVTKEELRACLLSGEPNKERYIWRKVQGQTLLNFAKEIERTVHETDEKIQIAPSANSSSFDFEGVLFSELAKVLAGKNRPIARLTGAPYWKCTNTLAPNIEAIRLQASWCNGEIDVISEGDTYPRPRYWTPSAFLEGYDMVLRADGCCNGILRYMIDYNSSPQYETGYMDRYVKNQDYYKETETRFSKGKSVGFNIFENPLLTEVRDYREIKFGELGKSCELFPLSSQWLFSDNSIPTCYGMKNCPSVAFGENGHFLTDEQMKNGVMLDVISAKILMSKGIDVGIESLKRTEIPTVERFEAYNELTKCNLPEKSIVYDMKVKDGTKILSEFIECSGGLGIFDNNNLLNCKSYPSCVYYENKKGMKFIIYSFDMDSVTTTCEWESGIFRNYCRQRQLADSYKYLSGEKLPAMCFGNPDLYILCKEFGNSLVVGLWNFFPDEVINPVIELSKAYSKIDFYNCQGSLEGDFVQLSESIAPYGFAYFTVE